MEWWKILLIIVGSFLLLYILGTIYFFVYIFKRSDKTQSTTKKAMAGVKRLNEEEWFKNTKKEHFTITSFDGLTLHADLLLNNSSHNYVIVVHGYKSKHSSSTLESKMFYDLGFNCLHISVRANDESEGKFFTMGDFERHDIVKWCEKLVEYDKDAKIVLFGRSMGANIVMESVGEKLPSNVICGIEDCGFTSCREQMIHMCKTYIKFAILFLPGTSLFCKLFKGFSINQDARKQLSKCEIPMLFIHGKKDKFVPYTMLDKVVNSCKSKKTVASFDDADHCECSIVDTKRYKELLFNFLKENKLI